MEATSLANELAAETPAKVERRGNPNIVTDTSDKTPRFNGVNASLDGSFFNDIDSQIVIQKEQPKHRLIVFLAAQGLSNKEISMKMEMSATYIGNVLRQPWARIQIIEELKEAGRDELRTLLKGAAGDSIHKLIDLRDKARSEAVQLGASQAILDRFLGKPNQPLTVANVDPETLPDSELAKLLPRN